ncbi:hypothetical protein CEXT_304441 [Caerostris extrusa]|uniref:Uncharacterized protein n=1 Tax=Caerostris extrusa TaxID=172846 RepID=A0AAV4P6L2_CAEEX|nr:hypothetical protein CEXT_304441 [Caerostris extrusa]
MENKLSNILMENEDIKRINQENENSFNLKIKSLISEKQEISACLKEELCKRQNLECHVEKLKQLIFSLDQDLSHMSDECTNIDNEILASRSTHEHKIEDLESKLLASQIEQENFQDLVNKLAVTDSSSEEQLKLFEVEKKEMASSLNAEIEKTKKAEMQTTIQELECTLLSAKEHYSELDKMKDERFKKSISSLEEALSLKEFEYEELNLQYAICKEELECKMQEMGDKLSLKEQNVIDFNLQLQEITSKEKHSKEMLQTLEKENLHLTGEIKTSNEMILKLEFDINELKSSFEKELILKSSKIDELMKLIENEKNYFTSKIQDMEDQLSIKEQNFIDLNLQYQEITTKENHSKEVLQALEKENLHLNDGLETSNQTVLKLEFDIKKLKASFEDELWTIQKLQDEIFTAKSENELLEAKVKDLLFNEEILQKKFQLLEKEKQAIYKQLGCEANKINLLELGIGELKKSNIDTPTSVDF